MIRLNKIISGLVIGCFCINQVPLSYPQEVVSIDRAVNLAPQVISKPILDKDLEYKNMLESFTLYKFKSDPQYFRKIARQVGKERSESNIFTDFGGTKIEFINAKDINSTMVFSVTLNGMKYFLCLKVDNIDKISVLAQTQSEFFGSAETLGQNIITYEHIEYFREVSGAMSKSFYSLDSTSEAYNLALNFLEEVSAFNLNKKLRSKMDQGCILAGNGLGVIHDKESLFIDKSKPKGYMAWCIIDQLVLLTDPGIFAYLWKDLRAAFYAYSSGAGAFSINDYPELSRLILKVEHDLNKASNEGDMDFHIITYQKVIDSEQIDLKHREVIKQKIREIFNEIALKEAKVYSEYFKSVTFLPSAVPGAKSRLTFERFSDRVIPVARANRDGTITINEKFVDVMTYLHSKNFDLNIGKALGNFSGSEKWDKALSLFDSIIYSVAIHEIRGHFIFQDGKFMFNPDEKTAQGQRGIGHIYTNVLSVMYFWLAICELGHNLNEERINLFMKDYPEVFDLLSKEEKSSLPGDLMKIHTALFSNNFDLNWISTVVIPVPGIVLSHLWRSKKTVSVKEMIERFKKTSGGVSSEKTLSQSLSLLVELGLVEVIKKEQDLITEDMYRMVPMTTNNFIDIKNIFDGNIKDAEDIKVDILEKVLDEGENQWATALVNLAEQVSRMVSGSVGEKIVVIYDNKWVPAGQRSLRSFQDLENSVLEAISKSGNIEVVKSSASGIALQIAKRKEIPLRNFIVVGGKEIYSEPELSRMLPRDKSDKDRLFCIAVDGNKLSDESYIQLVEIFNMVFKAYIGKSIYQGHPGIEQVAVVVGRYYVLIPRGQELGIGKIRDIYIRQSSFLFSA